MRIVRIASQAGNLWSESELRFRCSVMTIRKSLVIWNVQEVFAGSSEINTLARADEASTIQLIPQIANALDLAILAN